MRPRGRATLSAAAALLVAGGILGWHALPRSGTPGSALPVGNPATERPPESPGEIRAEIAALEAHLAALPADGSDVPKRAVYLGMLDQARKRLRENPLAMDWRDFYRMAEAMRSDEEVLARGILERLAGEAGLAPGQRREILSLLRAEREEVREDFRARHGHLVEADRLGALPEEESRRLAEEIHAIRKAARERFEPRWRALLPQERARRLVDLHLRNDFVCGYSTRGDILGGIGIPEADFEALDPTRN